MHLLAVFVCFFCETVCPAGLFSRPAGSFHSKVMEKQSQAVLKSEPGESGKWTTLAHHHRPVFLSLFLFRFYLFFSAVVDTKRTRQE